jgi:hypothetical protein
MSRFTSLIVVRQPLALVWSTVRDRLPELVAELDDVDRVEVLDRRILDDGSVALVNEWWAGQRIPQLVAHALGTAEVGWIDRCTWDADEHVGRWTIEPHVLPGHVHCRGVTAYEPAMGGRGVRVTVDGVFDLDPSAVSGLGTALRRPVGAFVESIVSTMIPRSTRRVVEAAARLIEVENSGSGRG